MMSRSVLSLAGIFSVGTLSSSARTLCFHFGAVIGEPETHSIHVLHLKILVFHRLITLETYYCIQNTTKFCFYLIAWVRHKSIFSLLGNILGDFVSKHLMECNLRSTYALPQILQNLRRNVEELFLVWHLPFASSV
jgi:hypothetical protein